MNAEGKNFFQGCLQCQCAAPKKPPLAQLVTPPVIGIPFERVGMNLVGSSRSLPRAVNILVIVDYTTHYSKAILLQKVTSKNIVREPVLLSSVTEGSAMACGAR